MADEGFVTNNVLLVSFEEDDNAYEALTQLKQLDSQGQLDLQAAAVVVRNEEGHVAIMDEVSNNRASGTATGGIIGLLIGVLGGPLGILIGGATGLLIGSLFDAEDEDDTVSVLSDISRAARVGHAVLLAEVNEPSPEVIGTAMSRLGGTVLRRSVAEVEAELAAAEDAQRAAKKQARKVLREQRLAKQKADIRTKIEELKAKLRLHKGAATTA